MTLTVASLYQRALLVSWPQAALIWEWSVSKLVILVPLTIRLTSTASPCEYSILKYMTAVYALSEASLKS